MGTPCESLARQSDIDPTADAVISIQFSRLWDLLSVNQRQYALHLTNPATYPATTPIPSLYTAYGWVDLPQSVRIAMLAEFRRLPGVLHVTAE